jgi:pre-rRNA-processing protein TSR3
MQVYKKMLPFLPTIILRHRKENLKKCSLKGLESLQHLRFYSYPQHMPQDLKEYVMIHLGDASTPQLSKADIHYGLFFLDSTWNYEKKMHDRLNQEHTLIYRSLPACFVTAYPRQQTGCLDPQRGLATVEALYIAYTILGLKTEGLLDNYYFRDEFLEKNQEALIKICK